MPSGKILFPAPALSPGSFAACGNRLHPPHVYGGVYSAGCTDEEFHILKVRNLLYSLGARLRDTRRREVCKRVQRPKNRTELSVRIFSSAKEQWIIHSGSPSFGGRKRSFAVQIFETAPMLRNVDKTTRHGVIDQRYDTPEEEEQKQSEMKRTPVRKSYED